MNIWQYTWKNMWHKKSLVWLTIMAAACASAFVVFVTIVKSGIEDAAVKGYGPYELVIGADGSRTQLMMNTFYHIGEPIGNIDFSVWQDLEKTDLVDAAFPMTRGDRYQGFPLIGVDSHYLSTRYPEIKLTGDLYKEAGEVVVGANVAKEADLHIGDEFFASHGYIEDDGHVHDDFPYIVKGILPKLGTADDKAIFTTLNYAWLVHHDDHHDEDHAEHEEHEEHDELLEGDITAIVIKPKGLIELQQIAQSFDKISGVQATYSSKTVSELLSVMDVGAGLVDLLSYVCILLALIAILLALTAVTSERKKDMGLLRLLGKNKNFVLYSVVIEAVIMTIIGACIGVSIGHIASFFMSEVVFNYAGIQINPWSLHLTELYIVFGAIIIGIIAAIMPALKAYRVNPLILFQS